METKTHTDGSPKTSADKLCLAAIISLLVGLGLFVLFLLILFLGWDSGSQLFEFGFFSLYLIFTLLVFFVAPFLGVFAVSNMVAHWRAITNRHDSPYGVKKIHKTAGRFLVASLLFASVSLLRIIFGVLNEGVQTSMLTTRHSTWFVATTLLALSMGCISYGLFAKASSRPSARVGAAFAILCGLAVVGAIPWMTNFGSYFLQRADYSHMAETFVGDSNALEQTAILPTLDSPCPRNRNLIWCSSFQLAWNRMKDDVIGAPVHVVGAEELADRLNSAGQSRADLEPDSFYAAAGRVEEGIISKVRKDMAAKFPSHAVPDFSRIVGTPRAILAYSYLTANVPFKYPFRQVKDGFSFTDSQGVETEVGAFGAWGLLRQYRKMREQVEILYFREDRSTSNRDLQSNEFAVDLCRHSQPYQVVVAVVELKDSLAQTLDYTRRQITDAKQSKDYERTSSLDKVDILVVPEMFWKIGHRFAELIGKEVANADPAMPIIDARQEIKFRLDRYGAMLESESTLTVSASPRYFHFNRPFLVYMKKRDREQPFFVMWVDNAELLNVK